MDSEKYSNKQLKSILLKYLEGQASDSEKQAIDTWYESFDSATQDKDQIHNRDSVYRTINHGIDKQTIEEPQEQNKTRRLWFAVSAAASIVLLTTIGFLYLNSSKPLRPEERVVNTTNNTRKTITLDDGTVVELNSNSRLVISSDYNDHDRKVSLEGQAFFDVTKNPDKPFVITSGELKTVVKGTSFDIRAYRDLGHIKVSVATGIVKILRSIPKSEPSVLTQGIVKNQTLTYDLKTKQSEIKDESTSEILSWRNNTVYIDNFTLPEIASLLSRHFSKQVILQTTSIPSRHYTMKMANPSLGHALNVLSTLTKHKFIVSNNKIIIRD
ncbi:FecR family protein [Desertivirga brevis]|uniref:FecR family protein n=1 Tax=Desertivirga brevis TaxID=2810310 RepID=UPI001A95BCA9|nr:FecR family protein [Pedobacter sp. SYSU D00873]